MGFRYLILLFAYLFVFICLITRFLQQRVSVSVSQVVSGGEGGKYGYVLRFSMLGDALTAQFMPLGDACRVLRVSSA